MAKYTRVTAKVFGETASTSNTPKEIGQFGSAKAGTYNATGDIATIQSLSAWSNGWIDAVTPTQQFPSLPEMTGVHKVLSYQNAYLLQQGIPEWDSGTTYYTNGFCSKAGKIYISQSDNNTNDDPESDTVNWNEFASGGASRNIGEIAISTTPLTDAGLHLLDGALLAYGSYQDVIDYYADLYNSGDYSAIFTTEATWQSEVTANGVCDKFVYDSGNNTLRLPKFGNQIYTSSISSTVAVKGNGKGIGWYDGSDNFGLGKSGTNTVFTTTDSYDTNAGTTMSGNGMANTNKVYGVTTDGSKSGIIADTSNLTTGLNCYYYIVIATTTKTQIQVDIDQIATDLNGKADVDLTNVNNSGTSTGASWAMPSDVYEDLTLGASGSTYSAPANGWFYFARSTTAAGKYIQLSSGNLTVRSYGPANGDWLGIYLPVKKNDTVTASYSQNTSNDAFRFIYAKGSESEA